MNDVILGQAAAHYGVDSSQLQPLAGGHFSAVYEFSKNGKAHVLRISPPDDEVGPRAMQAMLEFVYFLSEHGAPVSKPARSVNGRLVELVEHERDRYVVVVFEKARGVLAETLAPAQWNAALYRSIGRAVGEMHAVAKDYVPRRESLRRPEWNQAGNCFNPTQPLDSTQRPIQEKAESVLAYLQTLPIDRDGYGLIHADLHFGNFFVDPDSYDTTIFDFDDCAYGWYGMDIAMVLFDVLVLYPGRDREAFAGEFLKAFLQGYTAKNPIDAFWLKQLPHFLKLLEIGVYTQLHASYDPSTTDPWVGKFMPGRRHQIENDVPYVDVDFENLPAA